MNPGILVEGRVVAPVPTPSVVEGRCKHASHFLVDWCNSGSGFCPNGELSKQVLPFDQIPEQSFLLGKPGIGPVLHDPSSLDHHNAVTVAHRRQTMSYENGCPATEVALDGVLDQPFGQGVKGARRLIKNEPVRFGEQRSRDGHALALTAREGAAPFANVTWLRNACSLPIGDPNR